MRVFLISNMYPTLSQPGYGIFVKNVECGLNRFTDVKVVSRAVIAGKGKNVMTKVFKYLKLYFDIVVRFFQSYDVIYLHFPNQTVPLLRLLYLFKRPPLIINFHGEDLLYDDYNRCRWLGKQTMRFARTARALIVPSDYFKEEAIRRGLSASKIYISPSGGIDESIFSHVTILPRPGGRPHIGFIGRLEESKGIMELLSAIERLPFRVKTTIIGYGSLSGKIQAAANDGSIHIINGLKQCELPAFYSSFDLFVFPSKRREESLGLTGIESMACGTPVVGSNIGGIPTYLKDGYNGYLVRPGLVDDLVTAIVKYVELPEVEKLLMRRHCLETARKYYQSNVVRELAKVFYRLSGGEA